MDANKIQFRVDIPKQILDYESRIFTHSTSTHYDQLRVDDAGNVSQCRQHQRGGEL
jgi:hypothetical protein